MTTNETKDNSFYKAAKLILTGFVSFTIISYLYVLITGTYNGDYLDGKPLLSQTELFVSLIYTVLPFFVLFGIYIFFKNSHNTYKINIPVAAFGQFLLFLLLFQIITTFFYDVGKLTWGTYEAPTSIKIFIQIFNRFNPILGTFLYISVSKKENRVQYLLLFLCILLSFLRASLMIFVLISMFLFIRHYNKIISFAKKRFLLIIVGAIVFPIITAALYDYRDSLREERKIDHAKTMTTSKLFFGKFIGRLSSYPSTTILMERKDIVTKLLKKNDVSPFLYTKEAIAVFGGKILDNEKLLYKHIMLESEGKSVTTFSMMPGTQGNLMVASYNSTFSFFVTLFTMLGMVILAFFLISFFNYKGMTEIVFIFFCISAMSGVAGEYMELIMNLLLYAGFFLIVNAMASRKKEINT